ncbi:hypothetical protein L207DRAFT_640711 [Hyaloscypha variabilis F]|uniref:Xylanolytic transcriptional activator regulatory domain-containing protein n=1 Tax=Hyaloscypha variabilis (strain UAMH 11265 / GT02V1 / F) TaxID=1149755 RepID=A0A2J6QYR5_HYAVF|nr:hypothetical protein L207DRAFT_640711 [Hyaloscypha variabilis F]
MEDRIKRMESALNTSGLHGVAELVEGKEEEKSSSDKIESQAELSNHLSNLVIDPTGSPNFIGWASGFSLFSPQGVRWISDKLGNKEEAAKLVRMSKQNSYGVWGRADADLWYPIPRSQHSPLPSKDLALQYVNSFFISFNNVFPVVNQKVFNSYFERQYSTNPPAGSAWYALFNAVLCIGSIRTTGEREMHIRSSCLIDYTSTTQETGVEYFRNATCCFHELLFHEANLMAMQAMTLMMFITASSPNPQPTYVMASAAGNLANTLGLHRSLDGFGVAPEEIEQRRNVFWVFYLIEKAISSNLGRPSVINDDDIAVELPPKMPGLIQSPSGAKVYDIFQDQIVLAIIGSRIYGELYSASSLTKSDADRMKILDILDNHLQRWRDTIPIEIRPEHPINCSDEQYVAVVMMHFTYLDAVILLHRLPGHQEIFQNSKAANMKTKDQRPPISRVHASQLLCLAAARRSVQLLDTFSNNTLQNQHIMWKALYYPLSASLVLFTNILSNPRDPHAASDIHLMNLITSFITHAVQPGTSFATTPTLLAFKELYSIATRFVETQTGQKMNRLPKSDDRAEADFIPSSGVRLVPDESLFSDLNTQATSLFAPYDSLTTHSETNTPASRPSPLYTGQQNPTADHVPQSSTTTNRPFEFAPFLDPAPSQIDSNLRIYDSLLSPARFGWYMANVWVSSFEPDPPASAVVLSLPANDGMDFGEGGGGGYSNESYDDFDVFQQ